MADVRWTASSNRHAPARSKPPQPEAHAFSRRLTHRCSHDYPVQGSLWRTQRHRASGVVRRISPWRRPQRAARRGVDPTELGQVVDPTALDISSGPRARLPIELPASWMEAGADLELTIPARLPCARCDGGGCDACGRSGVLRAPMDIAARAMRLRVPAGSGKGVVLRLVQPFGDAAPIEQLLIEVRPGSAPSQGVRRIGPRADLVHQRPSFAGALSSSATLRVALAVLVTAIGLAAVLASR